MKNIVIYWPRWYPLIGGITTHVHELINGMPDHHFHIITNRLEDIPDKEKFLSNSTVNRVGPRDLSLYHPRHNRLPKFYYPYIAISDLIRIKKKLKFIRSIEHDILHVHGPSIEPNMNHLDKLTGTTIFSSKVNFKFDKGPKVLTCHGLASHYSDDENVEISERKLLNMFDKVICVDEYVYENARSLLEDGGKAVFIPNSIDVKHFSFKNIELGEKLKIGFVGRLTTERGTELINQLIDKMPDNISLRLIVTGSESQISDIKELVKGKDIQLFSNVDPKDMPGQLWKMDIILNPVIYEGSSRATLEAFACGRPAIMIDAGNRYPLIDKETGFLIENKIDELLKLIKDISENKNILKDMSIKARKVVEEEYSNEIIIPKIKKVYESLGS